MKRKINVFDYSKEIMQAVEKGVLLTTKSKDKVNTMSISWGTLGIQWNKNIFIAFVRESRFTKKILEENKEFTVNISLNNFDKKVIDFCGTKSGKDTEKIKILNLTLVDSENLEVPAIKEFPLTLECKIIYEQKQNCNLIKDEIKNVYYPFSEESFDYHTAYYGEIVSAYIIED